MYIAMSNFQPNFEFFCFLVSKRDRYVILNIHNIIASFRGRIDSKVKVAVHSQYFVGGEMIFLTKMIK